MKKLIKIQKQFYIIDDSEILKENYFYDFTLKVVNKAILDFGKHDTCKKITHSTQNLEGVIKLNLSDVEEVVLEHSEIKMIVASQKYALDNCEDNMAALTKVKLAWEEGFKTHRELVKDMLFTLEDIEQAIIDNLTIEQFWEKCCKFLLPKTEWNIEIDEDNKITLL